MKRRFLEYGRDRLMDAHADRLDATLIRGSRVRGGHHYAPGVCVQCEVPHSAPPRRRAGVIRWLVSPAGKAMMLPQGA